MKYVEAVIVSWKSAAGQWYFQWCLALTSGAVSHGDWAVSLRINCARLSLDAVGYSSLNTSHFWSLGLVTKSHCPLSESHCPLSHCPLYEVQRVRSMLRQ